MRGAMVREISRSVLIDALSRATLYTNVMLFMIDMLYYLCIYTLQAIECSDFVVLRTYIPSFHVIKMVSYMIMRSGSCCVSPYYYNHKTHGFVDFSFVCFA